MSEMQDKVMHKRIDFEFQSNRYGITKCCFKRLFLGPDTKKIIRTVHHHTFFETHFLVSGTMTYYFGDFAVTLESGDFILIPPGIEHKVGSVDTNLFKYSLIFAFDDEQNILSEAFDLQHPLHRKIPDSISDGLSYINGETECGSEISDILISNRVFEVICALARISGMREVKKAQSRDGEDVRLSLAEQYIAENICYHISCADVADYCHLSTRQLTRIFMDGRGESPSQYIRKRKIETAEQLIITTEMTMGEISEKLGFENEYYFNTFFKKNAGMSPGEYRKVVKS